MLLHFARIIADTRAPPGFVELSLVGHHQGCRLHPPDLPHPIADIIIHHTVRSMLPYSQEVLWSIPLLMVLLTGFIEWPCYCSHLQEHSHRRHHSVLLVWYS